MNKLKTSVKVPEVSREKDITSEVSATNFKSRVPKITHVKPMKNLEHLLVSRELMLI